LIFTETVDYLGHLADVTHGRYNRLNRQRRTKRLSVTEGNGIPKMKKLLWVNGRKSTDLERQHGAYTPEDINEGSTHQTYTKDKTNLVCFNLHEVCLLSLVVCVVHTEDALKIGCKSHYQSWVAYLH